ncbi:uncharacterized protein CMC5_002360 [Chondromyces crocatus]|uniref:Sulfatase-modifying factor enzyme-like domain-containing protein n=1 Tax=Chondromyces crocatus TaxID=52 RepID=A0A0K1E6E6_CHOCO|nr:uncharacterized protein CMC5_002360 [Chondromyces crocatus]
MSSALLGCGASSATHGAPAVVLEIAPLEAGVEASGPAAEAAEEAPDPQRKGMIQIPSGSFEMGFDGCDTDEQPVHTVKVEGFWMDVTEVTVEAYEQCVRAQTCQPAQTADEADSRPEGILHCNSGRTDRARHPVNCVTWRQADTYCRAQDKRLPTETEWEFAARGTKGRTFPWGDTFLDEGLCWDRDDGTCPVGSFPDGNTPQGLMDMAGNVWEWTASHYCGYGEPDCDDTSYVDRGGAWVSDEERLVHAAHRGRGNARTAESYIGFRCVRSR